MSSILLAVCLSLAIQSLSIQKLVPRQAEQRFAEARAIPGSSALVAARRPSQVDKQMVKYLTSCYVGLHDGRQIDEHIPWLN